MAECSFSPSIPGRFEPLSCSSLHIPAHDIFLSHSGAQKPFAKALYQRLRTCYTTFLDITHHSLPLGEHFPSHIFHAARTCRLAVVVVSEEYLQSKWPMLELCAFFAATPLPKILPLFFKLMPLDLKQKENVDKWRSVWQKFAEEDASRIDVSTWVSAFKKISSYNGVILDNFEEESAYVERVFSGICKNVAPSIRFDFSGIQGIGRLSEIVLAKFTALEDDQSKVCVLGMYGLPGSGKSMICRYLCACLFPQFVGKAIYLELPTGAKEEELLIKSKELLEQLTNFNNKMDLHRASNFGEVCSLLKGTDFVSSRVFLVVDNISSQESRNAVKALLRLGLTVGSKVLLVAHSINVLQPLLEEDGSHQTSHYVYGSMSVPGLNKEEALRILLHSGDGVDLPDSYAPEATLNPKDKEIMEEVVNMSGFSEEHGCTKYLPLVLKVMGEQLREHELNVETWNRTMRSFQIEIGLCKEEALKQMVLESFHRLRGKLPALFLDVALFIVPLSYSDGESHKLYEACSHLSFIHCCKSEEIEFEMRKLQQHGFLTIWKDGVLTPTISVHDFYLEFAASIEEASKYYWSCGHRLSKVQRNHALEAVGAAQLELRTVVLELEEGCEHFKFSSDLSRVRAMVLRNCKSLKTLQGFAKLRRLVSLEIRNCPSLIWVEPPANGHEQPYIQRLKWVNQDNKKPNVAMLQQQELETSSSKKSIWRLFWENLPRIGFMRPQVTVDGLLFQMKGLQVLRLENSGIKRPMDISGCLPQLRMLEVRERHMQRLRVCNLPNLERFVFFGDAEPSHSRDIACRADTSHHYFDKQVGDSLVPRLGVMLGKEFLTGCPKVQEVYMQCAAFDNEATQSMLTSSQLTQLRLNGLRNVPRLPDLSASLECLEGLLLSQCHELKSLDFGCMFGNLRELCLKCCDNLTEVSGLGGLPMLQKLKVLNCPSLKVVSGLSGLVSLQDLEVYSCPRIRWCMLRDLESLIDLRCVRYQGPHNANGTLDMRKSVKFTSLDVEYSSGKLIGVENLERLEWLHLNGFFAPKIGHITTLQVDLATLLGIMARCCVSLKNLELYGLDNLRSLKGIEFLGSLEQLSLQGLQNLSCLRGIECLGELRCLDVRDCTSVDELASLSTLVKLQELCFKNCKKLGSVEGCRELEQLKTVEFTGCTRLAHFPLDLRDWKSSIQEVRIEGSNFARGEVVVVWAEKEEVPEPLRHAALRALWYDYWDTTTSEMLVDTVIQKAIDIEDEEDDDDDNYDNNDKYEVEEGDDDDNDNEDDDDDNYHNNDKYEEEEGDDDDNDNEYEEECEDDGDYDEEEDVATHVTRLAQEFDYSIGTFGEVYERIWVCRNVLEDGLHCFAKLPKQHASWTSTNRMSISNIFSIMSFIIHANSWRALIISSRIMCPNSKFRTHIIESQFFS